MAKETVHPLPWTVGKQRRGKYQQKNRRHPNRHLIFFQQMVAKAEQSRATALDPRGDQADLVFRSSLVRAVVVESEGELAPCLKHPMREKSVLLSVLWEKPLLASSGWISSSLKATAKL